MNGKAFFLLGLFIAMIFSCKESTQTVADGEYISSEEGIIYTGDKPDDVVVQIISQPGSLHPTNGRTRSRDRILNLISQELIDLDIRTGEMVPVLIKEIPKQFEPGDSSYTVELDPDAKWPDGKAILAEDVLFSYKAVLCPETNNPQQKGYGEYLKDLQLDENDPRKIRFIFDSYYMNNLLVPSFYQIMDKRVYDPEGLLDDFSIPELIANKDLKDNPKIKAWAEEFNNSKYGLQPEFINAGSGPYQLEKWVTDQEIVLKRRDNYWGKGKEVYYHHQIPPSITFKIIRDPDVLELQLAGEEIDVAELGGESLRRLSEDEFVMKNYRLVSEERATFVSLPLNHRPTATGHPPFFVDKRVRQAIAYAIPIEELVLSFLGDERYARRIGSPVSSMSPDHNSNLKLYEHNPEKARTLLKEAGWEDSDGDLILDKVIDGKKTGFVFSMIYPANSQALVGLANQIKEELAKIGITCVLEGETGANVQKKLWARDFDMGMLGLGSTHMPYDFNQLFYSQNWPEGDNIYGFSNDEADRLIKQSRIEKDKEKRKVMVDRIQEILYDEKPCIFLYAPTKKLSIHKRFNGAESYNIVDHVILNNFEVIRPN